MKRDLSFILLFLLLGVGSIAQPYYVQLDDASGFNTSEFQGALENASSEIISVLPTEYQSQFKVYDFGFYIHHESYTGGLPEAMEAKKAFVENLSPYYLLFGKQSDVNGIYTGFWIEMNLPESSSYPCMSSDRITSIKVDIANVLTNTYEVLGKKAEHYAEAEIAAIERLTYLLNKSFNCCQENSNQLKNLTTCSCAEEKQIEETLSNNNYLNYDHLNVSIWEQNYTNINSNYGISLEINSSVPYKYTNLSTFSLTEDLSVFIDDLIAEQLSSNVNVYLIDDSNACDFETIFYASTQSAGGSGSSAKSNGQYDYEETIFILNFDPLNPRVFYKIDAEIPDLGSNAKSLSCGICKKFLKWFFKRASTNPTTIIASTIAEYAIESLIEYWFDQDQYETYLDALYAVTKRRGITGLLLSVAQNAINAPVADFAGTFASHFITVPVDQWDPLQAFVSALGNLAIQGFISGATQAKYISYLGSFLHDIGGKRVLLLKFIADRKLVRAWKSLPRNLRTVVSNLESVSRFLSTKNVDLTIFKNEVNSLGTFQNDFIRSLDNATGSTPYPRITNKLTPDTEGTLLGRFENGIFMRDPGTNAQVAGTWDYIVKLDGEIVVGRKHSWLSNGGEDVLAAGELKWNNGILVDINNASGHYTPTPGEGFNFLRLFRNQGVEVDNAWLTLRVEEGLNFPIFKQISPNSTVRNLYE